MKILVKAATHRRCGKALTNIPIEMYKWSSTKKAISEYRNSDFPISGFAISSHKNIHGVGLKINTFAGMPCWAIGQAVTAMAGQNMGSNDIERVKKTTKIGLLLNVVITLIVIVTVQLFAKQIITLFEPESSEVIKDGILYLRICCGINSLIYAIMYTFDSFAIGIGSANIAMINALLDAVFVRLPVGWLLTFVVDMGFSGVYIGQAISPILPAIVGLLYFKNKAWEKKKLIPCIG